MKTNNFNEPTHFESLYPADVRFEEIEKIFSIIKSGRSCELVGLPGSGRSNILKLLSYNRNVRIKHVGDNQKWFHFVYMDVSEVRGRNLYDVTKFILISLAYSFAERDLKDEYKVLNDYLKEAVSFNDELILFQALKKSVDYLAIQKELTVVLLFDRFEQFIQDVNEQFFSNLRILRNRAKYRFSVVFALTRPLEQLLEPQIYSQFSEFLSENIIYLSLHDTKELNFRLSYLEKVTDKKIAEKIKSEILKLTGGHGRLSRLSFETMLSEENQAEDFKIYLLNKSSIKSALSDIWNFLTPSEQTKLEFSNQGLASSSEIDLKYLENVGLVKNGIITIPLLTDFIKTLPKQTSENITFDHGKNEIYKGKTPLSEKLSASEFRLLKFLVSNPDRVCEKEEIIQSVWKDSKTQEGVTDQALDQIIYRLRKKIEDDPNNPSHIHTIKGRGIRFSP